MQLAGQLWKLILKSTYIPYHAKIVGKKGKKGKKKDNLPDAPFRLSNDALKIADTSKEYPGSCWIWMDPEAHLQ